MQAKGFNYGGKTTGSVKMNSRYLCNFMASVLFCLAGEMVQICFAAFRRRRTRALTQNALVRFEVLALRIMN